MSNAFTYRMPAGIPGDIVNAENATVEPNVLLAGSTPTAFGQGVLMDAATGKIRTPAAADCALYGINVRPYPTSGNGTDGVGTSTPPTSGMVDVLKRGYINVLLGGATAAARGGAVYCRIQNSAAGKPVGGFEAAADGGNTITVSGAYFTGPADASGNTVIAFNI